MIADSGCKRSVASAKWHRRMRRKLEKHGLQPVRQDTRERFRFGDGRVVKATCKWKYPMGLSGKHGMVTIAEVDEVVEPGGIDPERVGTLGTYVNRIVVREPGDPLP